MKYFYCIGLFIITSTLFAQNKSIHQEQSEYYLSLALPDSVYENNNHPRIKAKSYKAPCTLNKVVYGWHPYWCNGLEANYDWSLLSHFCYFSYEVDAATGNATTTHSFSTASSVSNALSAGVKVNLCVTLFSSHSTFLSNATSRQTLITNLINLISTRGAHGVNIDFEGLPLSQKTNFTTFMNDLANQMHAAIPGSEISTVLYAVDWNDVIDVAAMPNVDMFIIMGYDYYWTGSSTAGPNDPLFQFGSSYNYTLSRSVTYYLNKGVPQSKLILGLPYYGREWSVSSTGIPATTTASGVSRLYNYVKDNTSGNYSHTNRHFDSNSYSAYYEFTSGSIKQCFITEEYEMNKRMDLITKRGIGGMGIWALGYDDGYNEFWNAIAGNFTNCATTPCSDTLFDIGGGPNKNYYDNENYTYTIAPSGASSINLSFSSFNLENNYDYLYVYDGPNTSAAQFAGSPFTGSTIPATLVSSTGAITIKFTSDGATTAGGFNAIYTCTADAIAPVTLVSDNGTWKTNDFTVNFTDTDAGGSGLNEKFYQVMDFNGSEWRTNQQYGFFNDNFTTAIHADWNNVSGTWGINTAHLEQTDNANANTNLYASLTQNNANTYLYHWQMNQTGTGTNRRAGIHFFCDNPSLTNRGNSYFVYYRVDSDKCQIYEVISDTYYLMADVAVTINPNVWYDCKVTYNPVSGLIRAYMNNTLVAEWTDSTPLTTGNSISLRTGNTSILYDDIKVYKSRVSSENISIGTTSDEIRYENFGLLQNTCRINSIVNDNALNWSIVANSNINIDWTAPSAPLVVNDTIGYDIDVQNNNAVLSADYTASSDGNSGIDEYWYSVGITPGDSSIINWTNNSSNLFYVRSGLSLSYGQTYYTNIRVKNGAGITSTIVSSDGLLITAPATPPVAAFTMLINEICILDSIQLINSTTDADTYNWQGAGVIFNSPSDASPYVSFDTSGTYTIQLIANGPGGSDTLTQNISIIIHDLPIAQYNVSNDTLYLPSGFLACTNTSLNANNYQWSFGDGNVSTDSDPWNNYNTAGTYELSLIAGNGYCPVDTMTMQIIVLNSLNIKDEEKIETQIYPNPTSNFIHIKSNKSISKIEISDMNGKIVNTIPLSGEKEYQLNLKNVETGNYNLNVWHSHSQKSTLLIQKMK